MSTTEEEKTPERHRNFAIECNNRAWDLCVQVRTAAEDEELLNAAHAAAFHWGHAGNERNHMRATMLLAEAHALLGLGPTALAYANRMKGYFLQQSDTPDWELAFTHAIHAHAAAVAGAVEDHKASYAQAEAAIAAIAAEEDRQIVMATFEQVPPP